MNETNKLSAQQRRGYASVTLENYALRKREARLVHALEGLVQAHRCTPDSRSCTQDAAVREARDVLAGSAVFESARTDGTVA